MNRPAARGPHRSLRRAVVTGVAAWVACTGLTTAIRPGFDVLPFHHVHVAVDDPAWHMNRAAARLGGTRTILQGHGVGVRTDGQYVIFDRDWLDSTADARDAGAGADAAAVYREAADWLAAQGASVRPSDLSGTSVLSAIPAAPVVAVAFSAADLAAAVDRLGGRGAVPLEPTGETARYRLPSGVLLEIVAETGKPDDHWCPMHPDVRSAGPARCAICGMDLVPIPPPRVGEYRLDVAMKPRPAGGLAGLRMTVRAPGSGAIVTRFLDVHERRFHLFIISRDLQQFLHVHPDVHDDGSMTLEQELDPGQYLLIGDFLPADGTPQMVQRVIVTPGYMGALFPAPPILLPSGLERTADGVRVRLVSGPLVPLRRADLRFELTHAETGEPVGDLEPYLGAAGHLLIVSADLSTAIHGHPESGQGHGPVIGFDPVLPAPGPYKLWVQFQRLGRVTTVPFVIAVPPW